MSDPYRNDEFARSRSMAARESNTGVIVAMVALFALLLIGGLIYAGSRDSNVASNPAATPGSPPAATTGSGATSTPSGTGTGRMNAPTPPPATPNR